MNEVVKVLLELLLVVLVVILPFWRLMPALMAWAFARPLFTVLVAVVLAVVYRTVGVDYGLPELFWHEDPFIQFWAGFWVCLLFGLIVTLFLANEPIIVIREPARRPADRRSDARTRVGNTNRDFTPIFGRAHTWPCRASFPGRRICITTGSPAPTHTDAHHTGQHFHIHPHVGYSAHHRFSKKRRRARTASHSLSTYAPCWRCPTLRFPSESGSCRRRCGPIWSRRGSRALGAGREHPVDAGRPA